MKTKKHNKPEELSVKQQNYIEVVSDLINEHGHAHASAVAERLGVKKPSVTEVVKRLVDLDLLSKSGHEISLTPTGRKIAGELDHRHSTLRSFMVDVLGMKKGDADEAACSLEHSASSQFVDRILLLDQFMECREADSWCDEWKAFLKKNVGQTVRKKK